jgi:4-amino-4-deoxy-L-arabinose transferase-like glycosyltransferase
MPRTFPRLLWLALPMAYLLYIYDLGAAALFGPDEPRYASIAREMARSGDWVTPVLWGRPWFEKPALLYWMNAPAFKLGLGPDLAPRLPVAILSVAFLVFYWWMLRREFGCRAAWLATLILGTCAGWIGYSQVGVTDLPLAATYSAAMLLALPWVARRDARYLPLAAALLGLAVLAKSLVPLALCLSLIFYWRRFGDLLRPRVLLPFAAVALPWYLLCYWRNGWPFLQELFWKQQYQRVVSTSLQHVQHWWFYLPVLVGLLLPWTPFAATLARRPLYRDERVRFLAAIVVWGVVCFSIPINKLPGYLLPLFPAAAALLGIAVDQAGRARGALAACAALLPVFPVAAAVLPAALAAGGLSKVQLPAFQVAWLLPLAAVPLVWLLENRGRRLAAVACVAVGASMGAAYLKHTAAAELDRIPSARVLWRQVAGKADQVCVDGLNRGLQYSLNYYAGRALPECSQSALPVQIHEERGRPYVTASTSEGRRVDPNEPGSVTSNLRD